jgi:hypothetical protein
VQFYRYFVSQSSEFCHYNLFCWLSTSNNKDKPILRYRLSPETFGYTSYKAVTQNVVNRWWSNCCVTILKARRFCRAESKNIYCFFSSTLRCGNCNHERKRTEVRNKIKYECINSPSFQYGDQSRIQHPPICNMLWHSDTIQRHASVMIATKTK